MCMIIIGLREMFVKIMIINGICEVCDNNEYDCS